MNFEDLSVEQQEKARACKNADELLALAKSEGIDLTDDQLRQVAGGGFWLYTGDTRCPACGSQEFSNNMGYGKEFICNVCGHDFSPEEGRPASSE